MFPLSRELARKSTSLIQVEPKQALEAVLDYWENILVNQINSGLTGEDLRVLAAKIDVIRNLKKFEQVIRQNAN